MTERDLLRRLRRDAPRIGDDCAILPQGKYDLLVTTDQYIEDVHFRRSTHTARDIGWNAAARGLSDIAAMGGQPDHVFLSVALPSPIDTRFVRSLFQGVLAHGVELSGGDLSSAPQIYIDVTVLGRCPSGKALRRDGARPGDWIYVSGPLGKPRHRIQPRLDLGRQLRGRATACMDLSDGLSIDLARLCEESGVGAELDSIPCARGATVQDALHRGEDYELLFTSRRKLDHPRLGRIVEAARGIRYQDKPLPAGGWDHFSIQR
jgi:thiamine-monophosphate kinase